MAEPGVRGSSSDSWNRLLVHTSATVLLVFFVVAWLDFQERGGRVPGPLEPGNLLSEPNLDYVEDVFAPPIFRYEHNREFAYKFSIRNRHDERVTITDIPLSLGRRGPQALMVKDEILVDYDGHNIDYEPFRPIDLAPGEELFIEVKAHLAKCRNVLAPDYSIGVARQLVHFRLEGRSDRQRVPHNPIQIAGPDYAGCPPPEAQ